MVTVTTSELGTETLAMVVNAGPVRPEACCRAKFSATAAPSHGAPLWKTRLGRMVIVHTV